MYDFAYICKFKILLNHTCNSHSYSNIPVYVCRFCTLVLGMYAIKYNSPLIPECIVYMILKYWQLLGIALLPSYMGDGVSLESALVHCVLLHFCVCQPTGVYVTSCFSMDDVTLH